MPLDQSPSIPPRMPADMSVALDDGFCPACRPLQRCRRSESELWLHNNAAGPGVLNHVPLPPIDPAILELNLSYLAMNDDSQPQVARLKRNIGAVENVDPSTIRITGPLLDLFGQLPTWVGAKSVYRVGGDFTGYTNFVLDRPTVEIRHDLTCDAIDPKVVGAALAGADKPLFYATFPVTNPNQQTMSLAVIEAALAANPDAIIVLDQAYRRYAETPGLARYAQEHERVIYVDTAAKDVLLCGARVGWLTAGSALMPKLDRGLGPYVVSPVSVAQVNSMFESPETLRRMVGTVSATRDILSQGMLELGFLVRFGVGPWVMVYLGQQAADVERRLLVEHRIKVQLQGGSLAGWLRVSATSPCEGKRALQSFAVLRDGGHASPTAGTA